MIVSKLSACDQLPVSEQDYGHVHSKMMMHASKLQIVKLEKHKRSNGIGEKENGSKATRGSGYGPVLHSYQKIPGRKGSGRTEETHGERRNGRGWRIAKQRIKDIIEISRYRQFI